MRDTLIAAGLLAALSAAPALAQTAAPGRTPMTVPPEQVASAQTGAQQAPAQTGGQQAPAQTGMEQAPAQTGTPAPMTPAPAAPAAPAGPPQVTAGAAIVDAAGAPVGTVAQVSGATVVVDTGTNKVGVPAGNFSQGPNGLILGNTKAELDAAASQAAAQSQAQLDTLLAAGSPVHGVNGQVLGTVKTADPQFVTVTSAKGGDVRLPRTGFSAGANGLTVGVAQADFDKAVAASRR